MESNLKNQKCYTIEELDIQQHSLVLITSKRCSGKSDLVRNF